MKINIKKIDYRAIIPEYEHANAAGFDFALYEDTVFKSGEVTNIKTGLAMKIPDGHILMILPRSSTPKRFGLSLPHSAGVIDSFYCGDDNEIIIPTLNNGNEDVAINKGIKIFQGIIMPIVNAKFIEVKTLGESAVEQWS